MVIPHVLPMVWSMSHPLLFTGVVTISYMANTSIHAHVPQRPHPLDDRSHSLLVPLAAPTQMSPPLTCVATPSYRYPHLHQIKGKLFSYIDVCIDDLLGASQGPIPFHRKFLRVMSHSIDRVFYPLDFQDDSSLK